jgi:catechol 2,3-dioxygenase-like lactoylglutathione lyase family enzyme
VRWRHRNETEEQVVRLVVGLAMILSASPAAGVDTAQPPRGLRPYLVAISVANLEESAGWYERVLGLRTVEKKDLAQQGLKIAFLESHGLRLELVELKGSVGPGSCADVANPAAIRGFGKFAFQVDRLDEVVAALQKNGAIIIHDFRKSARVEDRSIIIKDPDGNWLQFFQGP